MSITYKTIKGDTFVTIARKIYGDPALAYLVPRANPGLLEPIASGLVLNLPEPNLAPPSATLPRREENKISVFIKGELFKIWESLTFSKIIDGLSTVNLISPFFSEDVQLRKFFKPFSYSQISIYLGQDLIFTGTLVKVEPILEAGRKSVSLAAYSSPGVLGDCTPSAGMFPLEFTGQSLRQIAEFLIKPFGLFLEKTRLDEMEVPFEQVSIKPTDKILNFLISLAQQRGVILGDDAEGRLVFRKAAAPSNPVYYFTQGGPALLKILPNFQPQEYYSHVTGLEPVTVDSPGAQFTQKNNFLNSALRPFTFVVADVIGGDLQNAVRAKTNRMLANAVSYSLVTNLWRDKNANLWGPNTLVTVKASDAMVYSEYNFLVRSVEFVKTGNLETATLNLVLPETFSEKLPERLPWEL